MPFKKRSGAAGRKQAPVPGPASAAYKKIVARKSVAKSGKARKHPRPVAAFSSLKSRQMLVERIKREIWASVVKINDAIISLALAGNYNAARALFDFAGVYSLPEAIPEQPRGSLTAAAPAALHAPEAPNPGDPNVDPVDAFFRSIGEDPAHEISNPKAPV